MKLQNIQYYFREVVVSMARNRWMTFASIGTVAVSLFVLGIFLILIANMTNLASELESQVQISVYLKDELKTQDQENIKNKLKNLTNVTEVRYISKEEAFQTLQRRLGEKQKILEALGESNPLPNSFSVTVKIADDVQKTAEIISKFNGVEEVSYGQEVAINIFDVTRLIRVLGFVLMIILTGATIFIISNTIRLTVFARRKEIAVMKYVGATDWFIRWPFVLEGTVLGLIGGGISAIALRSFYSAMSERIYSTLAFFPIVEQHPFMNYLTVVLILSGIAVGVLGSTVSLKKFLEV